MPPEMNFNPRKKRLQKALDQGEFVLFFEHSAPAHDTDALAAGDRLRAFEEAALAETSLNCALAITDSPYSAEAWRPVEHALALAPENRDRHLVYFSGSGLNAELTSELLQLARANALANIVVASGNIREAESRKASRRRPHADSVETIAEAAGHGFFTGCVTHPFYYTPWSLLPQYQRLVRKIEAGASFVVAQAGWDMLKLQSLRWYMCDRELFYPTVARLILLTPERVESILSGGFPGVEISADFRKVLMEELRFSRTQFEAAQYRRIELQVAGCRLLGFSGVQLVGVDRPAQIKIAAERIGAALAEFSTFDAWLAAYNSHLAKTEMAPGGEHFYLYDRVLHRSYVEGHPVMRKLGPPKISGTEKFSFSLRRFFFKNAEQQPAERTLLKRLLVRCRGCKRACRLAECEFICPEWCAKRLTGPCGNIRADGSCELPGAGECVFHKIARRAHWQGKLEQKD